VTGRDDDTRMNACGACGQPTTAGWAWMTTRDDAPIGLRCPQCGWLYTVSHACGPTHAIMAAEIKRAPHLAALVVREREHAQRRAQESVLRGAERPQPTDLA
jgi:hypothetical protein